MSTSINTELGKVTRVISHRIGLSEVEVNLESREEKAVNYDDITGEIREGDQVILNTTAVRLGLGTGGFHFVLMNLSHPIQNLNGPGHIMKLRYTPQQLKVLSIEEETAGYTDVFNNFSSLNGFPALIFSLHSALAPIVVAFKLIRPKTKIAYIMIDGGALPVKISSLVDELQSLGLIDTVITSGHAFGGDFEAVNIYSALITAKEIAGADAVLIGIGPGNVGTGTKWGFSGIQLGEVINAVNILGGRPIFSPRISFCDSRLRHHGISHQSITVLSRVALSPAIIVFPYLPGNKEIMLRKQIEENNINQKHSVIWEHGESGLEKLKESSLDVSTMNRSIDDEHEYFLGACAAGIYGAKLSTQVGTN